MGQEAGLVRALCRLLTSVTVWPLSALAALVGRILGAVRAPSVLAAVSEASIGVLACSLQSATHRPHTEALFYLLLYQHQEVAFKKVKLLRFRKL